MNGNVVDMRSRQPVAGQGAGQPTPAARDENRLAYLSQGQASTAQQDLDTLKAAGKVALKYAVIGVGVAFLAGGIAGFVFGRTSGKKSCRLKASRHLFE